MKKAEVTVPLTDRCDSGYVNEHSKVASHSKQEDFSMDWNVTSQLAVLLIAYIGGIGTIGYYISNSLGKRIDDQGKRIDDLRSDMVSQHNVFREEMKAMREEIRSEMRESREEIREDMREIRDEMRKNNELLIAHISDHTLHKPALAESSVDDG